MPTLHKGRRKQQSVRIGPRSKRCEAAYVYGRRPHSTSLNPRGLTSTAPIHPCAGNGCCASNAAARARTSQWDIHGILTPLYTRFGAHHGCGGPDTAGWIVVVEINDGSLMCTPPRQTMIKAAQVTSLKWLCALMPPAAAVRCCAMIYVQETLVARFIQNL